MQQPFPSKSLRRPRTAQDAFEGTNGSNGTLPLSINRPQARPMTPVGSSSTGSGSRITSPSRPSRSDLRPRNLSQYSNASSMNYERDSYASSDVPTSSTIKSVSSRRERNGSGYENSIQDEELEKPMALPSVIQAFQKAGQARKRAMTNGSYDREKEREREYQEEMQRQKQIQERVPGRKANGRSRTLGSIDAVLERIEDDWAFVSEPDFNPVDLALQLMDSTSTGKDIRSFRQARENLSRALRGSADRHYQAFAAALPHHASLVSHLTDTQTQVIEARSALQEAKDALGNKRSDLVQLWSRGQTIEEMLKLLEEIEHVKSIPDILESLMSEKRLLQASVLLVRSLKTIDKPEMVEIRAVADLRSYLVGQENALRDILIDELHAHIFLKSFWCETRWAPFSPNQESLPVPEYDKSVLSITDRVEGSGYPLRLKRFLDELATKPNDSPNDLKESELRSTAPTRSFSIASLSSLISNAAAERPQNPESDSFSYLETVMESLAVLGKLGSALDVVCQRLPSEINSLVESTVDEVNERAEMSRRMSSYNIGMQARQSGVYVFLSESNLAEPMLTHVDSTRLRLTALQSTEKQTDHEVLRDLFWTLYSKLDAVTQGLRVVYEIANRIGSRRDFKDSSGAKPGALFPLADMWQPIQSEVRTLLNDYLSDDERLAAGGRNPISSINDVLREARFTFTRDRGTQVFRFADTDVKTAGKALRSHEFELNQVLRETVPGLVQNAGDSTVQNTISSLGAEDRMLGIGHHRLLIQPDAFHVSVLFQPTLAFLDRVSDVLPTGLESTRASTELLDEFVLNVYLPQLEEKSSELFHQIITGRESFEVDPASFKLCSVPLLKAFTQLMALINSLCAMLRTTPFHRENYSRLILSVIIRFYQRCSDKFYGIVSHQSEGSVNAVLLVSTKWAQQNEMSACLTQLLKCDEKDRSRLCQQEWRLEKSILGEHTIPKEELLGSVRDVLFLANLYQSITWFTEQLAALRSTAPDDPQSPNGGTSPVLPVLPKPPTDERLELPLSREMGMRFDALLKTYEQLAEMVIFTVRVDMRCRAVHYLHSAIRFGNYKIDQEDGDPDPHVIDLNGEIGKADECISSSLPAKERLFVFEGLEGVMEELLITNSRHIRVANSYGIKKVLRNILALRQSIKTMTSWSPNAEFKRARDFYNLFDNGPQALLDHIKQDRTYTFDEYKAMLNLQCGVDQSLVQSGSIAQATDKKYSTYVIELHGMELEDGGEDDL